MRDEVRNTLKSALLRSCRYLLAPVVRMLLRGGVTWPEFEALGKEVYVEVARRDYGLQGRPTNSVRVAMLTGLSRREVGRVKSVLEGAAESGPAPLDRISQVLSGWHQDPEFLLASGQPKPLARDGAAGSIEALLKRYAGDMPHSAVLKELERLGLVVREDDRYRVTARNYVRSTGDPDRIRQAGIALHDHAETIAHNVDVDRSEPAHFERMATTVGLPRRHLAQFHAFVEARGQALLEEVDAWLAQHAGTDQDTAADADPEALRCGVGIYLIQNETRGIQRD